jgi:hypothetical protein
MSPLGEAIYQVLSQRAGLKNPLLTYGELVQSLPQLAPPYADVTPYDDRLFRALGEVGRACREHGLATLTALVIRSAERTPGTGHFSMFHPETGDDAVKQREAWERELERVRSAKYPANLVQDTLQTADTHADEPHRSSALGHLWFADNTKKPSILFTGQITCPRCSKSVDVEAGIRALWQGTNPHS